MILRTALLIVTALVLQLSLFNELTIAGVTPDIMLLLAIAAGLTGGSDRGAVVGFFSGLAIDLVLTSPFGLSAFAYAVTGYAAGFVENSIVRPPPWMSAFAGFAGTILGIGLYVVAGSLLGEPHLYTDDFWRILSIAALYNGLLSPLIVLVYRIVVGSGEGGRVRSRERPSLLR